jgi:hypothetical protein
MDAQVMWDPLGTCSCYHGVTSVVTLENGDSTGNFPGEVLRGSLSA